MGSVRIGGDSNHKGGSCREGSRPFTEAWEKPQPPPARLATADTARRRVLAAGFMEHRMLQSAESIRCDDGPAPADGDVVGGAPWFATASGPRASRP